MRSKARFVASLSLLLIAGAVAAQAQNLTIPQDLIDKQKEWAAKPESKREGGTQPEDWRYTLPDGVTTKQVRYYSDDTSCYGKLFFPKGFDTSKKYPAIIVAHGTNGISIAALEKYGARYAENGMVAMVIDYRGYGYSDGWVMLQEKDTSTDAQPLTEKNASVLIKRTRLLNHKQFEDYRSAISYVQGEPGVDPNKIGIWGSSLSGGTVLAVAGADSRVKAVVAQVPACPASVGLPGAGAGGARGGGAKGGGRGGNVNQDAVKRARTGQGGEKDGGFSIKTKIDQEGGELRTGELLAMIPKTTAVLFLPGQSDELGLTNSPRASNQFLERNGNPTKVVILPHTTHFQAYAGPAFEMSSGLAVEWFKHHLK